MITCVLQVRKDLEDPTQLCPPSVLQESEHNSTEGQIFKQLKEKGMNIEDLSNAGINVLP